ncbi:MAG: malonate--CoA ligase [Brevirhabdus sp.]
MANPLFDALFAPHEGRSDPFLFLPDDEVVTFDDFLRRAAQFANALTVLGVTPGDRLVVQVQKSPDALAVYAACVQAGVVLLPLNTAYTPTEVSYFLEDSGSKLMVCDPGSVAGLEPVAQAANARLETLGPDGAGSFAGLADTQPSQFQTVLRAEDDLASLLYTSGTTGRSKGAMMSHANLLSNTKVLAELWQFTESDVLVHALPIFHTHGLFVATNIMLLVGGAMRFLPKFDMEHVLEALPTATSMMGVPTFYTRLLDEQRFDREHARHMRLFISGSAPLLADTHAAFEARTGHRILERYGMTETCMNASNPYDGERRAGTVGPPLPGVEIIITDPETGQPVPDGEIGMVEVRGPNVFSGYWKMPEKTREELRENGFFITGDLGRFGKDGYLTIVGRGKDLIISGGFNIYPKEVELVLDAQPGVLESAVIGVPHPDFGEAVVAVLVADKGKRPDLQAIGAALNDQLARFKQPKVLRVVEELPRNTMGKVQKNQLRAAFAEEFTAQAE